MLLTMAMMMFMMLMMTLYSNVVKWNANGLSFITTVRRHTLSRCSVAISLMDLPKL
jgi:hypothetical protein